MAANTSSDHNISMTDMLYMPFFLASKSSSLLRFKIAYRTVQGIVRGLSDYIKIEEMHFTDIRRRILKVKPQLNLDSVDDNKPVTLIVDTS